MTSFFYKGARAEGTPRYWHGLEEVRAMSNADEMIRAGLETGAWPTRIALRDMTTVGDLPVPGKAVVARYGNGELKCHAAVGNRYEALSPAGWANLVRVATEAGAVPNGAFSLRDGSRPLAVFKVDSGDGIESFLTLVDDYAGRLSLMGGLTSVRVVCQNTLSAAVSADGDRWSRIRHTGDMLEKAEDLGEAIAKACADGSAVRALYAEARETRLHRDDVEALLDRMFPMPAEDARTDRKVANVRKARAEVLRAASLDVNVDNGVDSLASIWNALTFTVDRKADGTEKRTGGDPLDSKLFGTRAKRIASAEDFVRDVLDAHAGAIAASVA